MRTKKRLSFSLMRTMGDQDTKQGRPERVSDQELRRDTFSNTTLHELHARRGTSGRGPREGCSRWWHGRKHALESVSSGQPRLQMLSSSLDPATNFSTHQSRWVPEVGWSGRSKGKEWRLTSRLWTPCGLQPLVARSDSSCKDQL